MGKLHQVIAAETDLAWQARSALTEATKNFSEIQNYLGQTRRYSPFDDNGVTYPSEDKNVPRQVSEDLNTMFAQFSRWLDVSIQKEISNQSAEAELKIGDKSIVLPVSALLNLEQKLLELQKTLARIPTLDPAQTWVYDVNTESYVSSPRISLRNEKQMRTHVQYDATDKHPAQVQTYTEDVPVGEWTTINHSSAVPIADKRRMLEKLTHLLHEVKLARSKANEVEAVSTTIAEYIIPYLWG